MPPDTTHPPGSDVTFEPVWQPLNVRLSCTVVVGKNAEPVLLLLSVPLRTLVPSSLKFVYMIAIISRVRRPPGSVEVGQTGTDGLDEPHAGDVTNACQYTTFVPSAAHAGSARPFRSGSQMLPLPGVGSSLGPHALICCP